MLTTCLIALTGVSVLNFILIWDLMNRAKRLAELHMQVERILKKITWTLQNGG